MIWRKVKESNPQHDAGDGFQDRFSPRRPPSVKLGGEGRNRTADSPLAGRVLSQLSYFPKSEGDWRLRISRSPFDGAAGQVPTPPIAFRLGAAGMDLNPRPALYRSAALPTELQQHSNSYVRDAREDVVWVAGFEPAASAFRGRPSTGLTLHPEMVGRGRLAFMAAILSLALAACATVDPPRPPEVRTTTVEVRIPIAIPCFTEAERPVLPPPTPIDIDRATVDQMAAAIAADDLADALFVKAVDALFLLCMKRIADGTANQPIGAKQ